MAEQAAFQMAIVRHGQSQGNVDNVWEGARGQSELTPLGVQQAQATALYLREAMAGTGTVYSSPLRRALQTADFIAEALGAVVEPVMGLMEIDWGELEGLTMEQVAQQYPDVLRLWGNHLSTPLPGGDAASDVAVRMAGAMKAIALGYELGGRAVLVSHQGAITLGLAALLEDEAGMMNYQASNGGVMLVEFDPQPVLKVRDYTEHLIARGIETGKWSI